MKYEQADALAHALTIAMKPLCEQGAVRVAGSIRRCKPEVKDIEIVVAPMWMRSEVQDGLFDTKIRLTNLLHQGFHDNADVANPRVQWIKPGTSEIIPWEHKPEGKYWRGYLPEHDMKLDLFLCTRENWGTTFLIRTGSADFSRAVVTYAKTIGFSFNEGFLWKGDEKLSTPTEASVFAALGLEFIPPQFRENERQIRPLKATTPAPGEGETP